MSFLFDTANDLSTDDEGDDWGWIWDIWGDNTSFNVGIPIGGGSPSLTGQGVASGGNVVGTPPFNPIPPSTGSGNSLSGNLWNTVARAAPTIINTILADRAARDARNELGQSSNEALDVLIAKDLANEERFQRFIGPDVGKSLDRQRTIAGAKGPEAQKEFFDNFNETPLAKFKREQGLKSMEQSFATQPATLKSGTRLKSITDFIDGLTSSEIDNEFNRLGAITGVESAANLGFMGVQGSNASGQANIISNRGVDFANSRLGRASALQSGVSSFFGNQPAFNPYMT